ncbi:L-seryl-tRNA(Sec) kinase-like [Tubulanus polymorphus]|uniref:L-seryl-tRNA(Sec) kinase-like n=1 Tax=Tubulanus polymorphus TaxID=672921 RepID=UPI003DA4A5F4
MTSRICILVLSGFPASGKTTLAKALQEFYKNSIQASNFNCYHVCYDEILSSNVEQKLLELRGKADHSGKPSQWKEYRRKILRCVEHLITMQQPQDDIFSYDFIDIDYEVMEKFRVCTGLQFAVTDPDSLMDVDEEKNDGILIIIDDNMYYRSMRYEYYQMAKKYECGFAEICVACSTESSLQRNHTRGHHVADDVIISMASRFEPPDPTGNAWEINSLIWNTETGGNWMDVTRLIDRAMNNPVIHSPQEDEDKKQADRIVCSTNLLHQSDQILRKLVANRMTEAKGCGRFKKNDLKSFAACLNKVRTRLLADLKKGKLLLPQQCNHDVQNASKNKTSPLYVYLTDVFYHWHSR